MKIWTRTNGLNQYVVLDTTTNNLSIIDTDTDPVSAPPPEAFSRYVPADVWDVVLDINALTARWGLRGDLTSAAIVA